jgi:hypothetical protein
VRSEYGLSALVQKPFQKNWNVESGN